MIVQIGVMRIAGFQGNGTRDQCGLIERVSLRILSRPGRTGPQPGQAGRAHRPAASVLVASSGAGANAIACASHNGGQVEPVGRPLAGTILPESGRTAL
jgi:hypothetical protein